MSRTLFRAISYNTLQVLVNPILGTLVFLLISCSLNKTAFGELSWALAILSFLFTILSFRLEQIVVRNVAAGQDPSALLRIFLLHNLLTGGMFFLLLSAAAWWWSGVFPRITLLWLLAIPQLLSFLALPFRQVVTGRSGFGWLALLSLIMNGVRAIGLLLVLLFSILNLRWVLVLFLVSSLAELLAAVIVVTAGLRIRLSFRGWWSGYAALLRGSLPQIGVVVLNAGIARMDWILLGIFCSAAQTADYSFAYKAFELSPVPMLILAPLILNRFSRTGEPVPREKLALLIRWEMLLATFLPLLANIVWAPWVDAITHHRYGAVNSVSFLLLSACIPFQYLVNILWSRDFAHDRLRRIFFITSVTAAVILAGDWVLIPRYAGAGAGAAFLLGMVVQYVLYASGMPRREFLQWTLWLLVPMGIALFSGWLGLWLGDSWPWQLVIGASGYWLLMLVSGFFKVGDVRALWRWLSGGREFPLLRRIKDWAAGIDWSLLLFLLLVLNVKLVVKVAAVLLAFVWHRRCAVPVDFLRRGQGRFYLAMLLLAAIQLLTGQRGDFSWPGLASWGLGCLYWLLALGAGWQLVLFVRNSGALRLHRTTVLFYILHIGAMFLSLLLVCIRSGSLNPYTWQGEHQKYFMNTGDYIRGITMDSSVTGAMISALGLVYFLYQGKRWLSALCLITVLLAGSNFVNILMVVILVFVFLFRSDRLQKSVILIYGLVMVVFLGKISPQNLEYVGQRIGEFGHDRDLATTAITVSWHGDYLDYRTNRRDEDFLPVPAMVGRQYGMSHVLDSLYPASVQDSLNRRYWQGGAPGRRIAWKELGDFFMAHPARLLAGAGMGHFSSRLALKTTGWGIAGEWPASLRYIHPWFRDYYGYLYLYYFVRDQRGHSIINQPDSVYGQMLGEYGLMGLLAFLFLYGGWCLRRAGGGRYVLPMILLIGISFFTEYWFEQLSVVVLFEFFLLQGQPLPVHPQIKRNGA